MNFIEEKYILNSKGGWQSNNNWWIMQNNIKNNRFCYKLGKLGNNKSLIYIVNKIKNSKSQFRIKTG